MFITKLRFLNSIFFSLTLSVSSAPPTPNALLNILSFFFSFHKPSPLTPQPSLDLVFKFSRISGGDYWVDRGSLALVVLVVGLVYYRWGQSRLLQEPVDEEQQIGDDENG